MPNRLGCCLVRDPGVLGRENVYVSVCMRMFECLCVCARRDAVMSPGPALG